MSVGCIGECSMSDIVALGELLVDFSVQRPESTLQMDGRHSTLSFLRGDAGGGPANVLAMGARMGSSTIFIGKVGRDPFGLFLAEALKNLGVGLSGLVMDPKVVTTLAFVTLDDAGERNFGFYRNPGADTQLTLQEVQHPIVTACRIFHFSSLSLTHNPSRSTALAVAAEAHQSGAWVSFDPNWRPTLWPDVAEGRTLALRAVRCSDILKVSESEMEWLTGLNSPPSASKLLLAMGPRIVLVTLGERGSYYQTANGLSGKVPTVPVQVVDTTATGDAFMGAFLHAFLEQELDQPGALEQPGAGQRLQLAVQTGNVAGALTAAKAGTMAALPSRQEVLAKLSEC
ncbi:carbohydrate kinase [Alicyclobacillaceae bacterium I2511]|nr:carbohydrate kinase [Alicyclobacillaceae bacterium I2511]